MTKFFVAPVLVAGLFAGACGGDSGPTAVDTSAKVRFFNAVWNAPDKLGFTANSQFTTGSALAYLQSTPSCATLNAGNTSFAIGLSNTAGTALNSEPFVLLTNQAITAGGNYTVLAGGNVIHPSIVMLDNKFSGTLGANQAAVRFVNLAAAVEGPIDVLKAAVGGGAATSVQTNIAFRDATPFSVVASGPSDYAIKYTGTETHLVTGSDATVNLQAGTINTVILSRMNPPEGKFQLITVQSCS